MDNEIIWNIIMEGKMETKEKLLTIIVPIYNVEAYLNQCLDSLVYQTEKTLMLFWSMMVQKTEVVKSVKNMLRSIQKCFSMYIKKMRGWVQQEIPV